MELTKRAIVEAINAHLPGEVAELGFGRGNDGLRIRVVGCESASWVQNVSVHGKRVRLGLGRFPLVSVQDAKALARKNAEQAALGNDPREAKQAQRKTPTLSECVHAVLDGKAKAGRAASYIESNRAIFANHCPMALKRKPVDRVKVADVIGAVEEEWRTQAPTAKRLLQLIRNGLEYAVARGYESNPAIASGKVMARALGEQGHKHAHHAACSVEEAPASYAKLAAIDCRAPLNTLALRFTALAALRVAETASLRWEWIDGDTLTIPPECMKGRRVHRVPLSAQALAVLDEARELGSIDGYVFNRARKVASTSALRGLHTRAGLATIHGWRSTFRVWCQSERIPFDYAEAALAHLESNAVVRAYARDDFLGERAEVMQRWADHLAALPHHARKGTRGFMDMNP